MRLDQESLQALGHLLRPTVIMKVDGKALGRAVTAPLHRSREFSTEQDVLMASISMGGRV